MKNKTRRLTESAMLLAIAIVLELVGRTVIPPMPFGGQLTIVCMLPVVLISYRHGVKWGFVAAFTYSLLQMALGAGTVTAAFQPGYFGDAVMIGNALLMCLLDYVAAYTLLGLGGIFRGRFSGKTVEPARQKGREPLELCLGSLVALACRYAAHVLSGYILFSGWAEWFFTQDGFPAWGAALVEKLSPEMLGFAYSLVYNGMYMVPEMIFTALAAVLIARMPGIVTKVN